VLDYFFSTFIGRTGLLQYLKLYTVKSPGLLTLGAHAQEGYSSQFVSVCLSVTALPVASFISTLKLRYEQLYYRILFIFDSWIFIKLIRSEVMALFAYHVSRRHYCSDLSLVFATTGALTLFERPTVG